VDAAVVAPEWLRDAVSSYVEACRLKLVGPGDREAAIRSPLEALLRTAGQRYEAVAATLGASPTLAFRRVTVPLVVVSTMAGGMAWLVMLSTLGVAAQAACPAWVRARALGVYLLVFQGTLAVGSFALLGRLFGILTTMHLLEMANPTQPLLRRLLMEAPGTYHHSIMVGNLAERAAEVIGADSLLVRVAAYYHDVGKLERPWAFIENQAESLASVNDTLDPMLSAQVLAAHVTDGVKLAEKYRLPPKAREMIDAGLAVVLATDFNPGSSPTPSMPMVLSLAATQMKMTTAECMTAATITAAYSLNRGAQIGPL